jgi:non-heme chloroperoxidase
MRMLTVLLLLCLATPALAAEWNYTTVPGVGGVPLNVVSVGDPQKPGILLVHGIGQSHYSFRKQLESDLAEDFHLVSFDLRGHGASGKPWDAQAYLAPEVWSGDVLAVMQATGLKKPVMVAWSYGTFVAMDFIRTAGQEELAGLVLTGATGGLVAFTGSPMDEELAKTFTRLRELQVSSNPADNFNASDGMVDYLTEAPIAAEDREVFRAVGLMFPAYARRAMVSRNLKNEDLLDTVNIPVLMALGEHDLSAQGDGASSIPVRKSNFKLSIYKDAGHSVFYEQAEKFNQELRAFAKETVGQAPANSDELSEKDEKLGSILFLQCRACHSLTAGDSEGKLGPSLHGVFGRKAGSADHYENYSTALREMAIEWDRQTMNQWLANPSAMVPGTTMVFSGISDEQKRELLVRYLEKVTKSSAE